MSDASLNTVNVLLPLPVRGSGGRGYTYGVPDHLSVAPGDFVVVPLGVRKVVGVVWDSPPGEVAAEKLKDITEVLETPPLPDVSRKLVEWVANYTMSSEGSVLKMAMSVPDALYPPKLVISYRLADEMPDLRMTAARERVISVLTDSPPCTGPDLAREAGTGPSVIKGLHEAGALVRLELPPPPTFHPPDLSATGPTLSPEQAKAADDLVRLVKEAKYNAALLDGVPGSGKTEVYLEAVCEAVAAGKQALVLLPEIALSAQWLERFRLRFGTAPALWHSDLTGLQRRVTWRAVATGEVRVVVGARSALFLPYPDLGVIVVDEEHDGSFKQEDWVVYNARDMAVVRANLGDIPVVLASATPSLETMHNVNQGRYGHHTLPDRHAGAELPSIEIADMRSDAPDSGKWLSPKLVSGLKETFARGEQALLFLNRRGYAPLTLCRACGHRLKCPQCSAWLVEHRLLGRMKCHHCGYGTKLPDACPECEAEGKLFACGPGVERLAEEVRELFPDIRFEVVTSDTIYGPSQAAELVRRIEDQEIDLMIGTQIVAKGYHFPMLTLVGVVDADLGLAGGELRAAERTFQLLYQVAGRAGRAERPGRVIVQTYMPDHPVIRALGAGDRDGFLAVETADREIASMPPYGRLAGIVVSGIDEAAVETAVRALSRSAPRQDGVMVLGPADAPLKLLRGRHRRRFLVKTGRNVNIQARIRQWLNATQIPRKVRVHVDIDPYSFM